MSKRSVTHATFVVERVFDAPPSRVFAACTDPAEKIRWFHGTEEWGPDEYEGDIRVGGREYSKGGPNGGFVSEYEARFQEIIPDVRVISTYEMHIDGKRISVSLATQEFKPDGKRTRFVYTEAGAFLDEFDRPEDREQGTRELLDALGAYLARDAVGAATAS